MAKKNSKDVQDEMAIINEGNDTGNEVVFDPQTGELVVVNQQERIDDDATVVTSITKDGFASNQVSNY